MLLKTIIFLHILASMVWTGGHLVLSIGFLPKALRKNDFKLISNFENKYEPVGMPALLILVLTGIYMATIYTPDFFLLDFSDHYTRHIALKVVLLAITMILAIHARFFLIPKKHLKALAVHIILVTLMAILFVFLGFSVRSGGLL